MLELGAQHGREQPGADDVLTLRAQGVGEHQVEELRVALPAAGDLRREARGRPGVHDVELALEANAAVGLGEAGRDIARGVDREGGLVGHDDAGALAFGVELVPDRKRHPEEALARDQPVAGEAADPVLVAHAHEVGVEVDARARREQALLERFVAGAVRDVPLARRDDLERLVALLEEFHRVRDLARLAVQVAGFGEQFDHAGLGAEDGLARELGVGGAAGLAEQLLGRGLRDQAAVAADDGAVRQIELAPPDDVGDVAEGADHGDARALVLLGQAVRDDRHLDAEHRRRHRRAEQALVALIVRVRDQRDTRGQQLGAGGLDLDGAAVGLVERHPVVGRRLLLVLQLGLGDRGAEGHVPQGGRIRLVRLAAGEVPQERALRRRARVLIDRAVGQRPVDAEPEGAPEVFELLLVLDREALAELDEVAAADRLLIGGLRARALAAVVRGSEVGVVGQRGVAAHAVVVLHATLGRQAVVVPPHRVEQVLAVHALKARRQVHVRVAEDVADVQTAGGGRRRRVDAEHRILARGERRSTIESVGAVDLPGLAPLRFEALECGLVGNGGAGVHADSGSISAAPSQCPESGARCLSVRCDLSLPTPSGSTVGPWSPRRLPPGMTICMPRS